MIFDILIQDVLEVQKTTAADEVALETNTDSWLFWQTHEDTRPALTKAIDAMLVLQNRRPITLVASLAMFCATLKKLLRKHVSIKDSYDFSIQHSEEEKFQLGFNYNMLTVIHVLRNVTWESLALMDEDDFDGDCSQSARASLRNSGKKWKTGAKSQKWQILWLT